MSPKSSEAKIKANRKYTENNYKKVSAYFGNDDMLAINNYCKQCNYSKNGLIVQSVKEKIERDTGKSFDEFLKENQEIKNDGLNASEIENTKEK